MHYIDPILFKELEKAELTEIIAKIITSIKRTKIVKQNDDYIHAEFKTGVFRFVDDVEFYFDDNEKVIHFRSASRIGKTDFGTNRKRMEKIRKQFLIKYKEKLKKL